MTPWNPLTAVLWPLQRKGKQLPNDTHAWSPYYLQKGVVAEFLNAYIYVLCHMQVAWPTKVLEETSNSFSNLI